MDYKTIEGIAAISERRGGYAHISGPEDGPYFEVCDGPVKHTVKGRDCVTFLQILLRRSQAREVELRALAKQDGFEAYDDGALAQQLQDGRREVVRAVEETLSRYE